MKPEEKYLDQLFETAREEESHTSLESVSETFLSATSPTGFAFVKELLLKNINLNSVLFMAVGSLAIFGFWLMIPSSSTISKNSTTTAVTSSTSKSSVKKDTKIAFEKPVIDSKEISVSTFSIKENNEKVKLKHKQNTKPNSILQKKDISLSPKISAATTFLEKNKHEIIPEIRVEKKAKVNIPSRPQSSNSFKGNTYTSPWVASGTGGATHMDWTIQQSNHIKKVNEDVKILQQFMNADYLKTILEKDKNGAYIPLTIVANYFFDEKIYLEFNDKKIRILNQIPNDDRPFLKVTKFKRKKKKAYLEFDYKDEKVQIQLKKYTHTWKYHKLKAKNNSGKYINVTL